VVQKRRRITVFKVGCRWIFKHFFDHKEIFKELADHYDKDNYRELSNGTEIKLSLDTLSHLYRLYQKFSYWPPEVF
jgi:hypothetical protein